MNNFLPITDKKIGILGAGLSGLAAAELAQKLGANVFVTDFNKKNKINIKGIDSEYGNHSNKILNSDFIIKSPGISRKSKIMKIILNSSIPVVSELEFASWFTESFIIALTGTNGKTTTVELINNILKDHGLNTFLGGNIGVPFSRNVINELNNKNNKKDNFHILEASSFQLEDIKYFKPNISIILNISPDHLDRYDSFKDYLNAKLNILINQDKECYAIINNNDLNVSNEKYDAKIINFSFLNNKLVINNSDKSIDVSTTKLIGTHNHENIAAASIVSNLCGIKEKSIINSINNFKPLSHRLEKINIKSNKNYYNDSKATNLSATLAALESIDRNIILILGGIDKNNSDFSILKNYSSKIKNIILYGQSRDDIKSKISNYFNICTYKYFKDAVEQSIKLSERKDNILLSPSCASFDQFNSYKERGNYFKEIIFNSYE
jgi:UDP-N-acetylmuramoylalanine--D-glutamate ligase